MARLPDRNVRLTKGEIHWPRKYLYRGLGRNPPSLIVRRPVCGSKSKFEFRYTNKQEKVTCGNCRRIVQGWNQ